jgi:hypothetical protein
MKTVHVIGLLIALLCAGQLLLAFRFWKYQLLESSAGWLWSIELKRHCLMRLSAAAAYPCPAEERVLIFAVLRVPIWWSCSVVGLPAETDARIESVQADEFNAAFEPQFRQGHMATRPSCRIFPRATKG